MHKFTKALAAIGLAAVMSQLAILRRLGWVFWSNSLKSHGFKQSGNLPIRPVKI